MTEEMSHTLISRILGRPLDRSVAYHWPESIKEATRTPLFAVIMGALLRDNSQLHFASIGHMLKELMDIALQQTSGNSEELDRLLQDLAVKTIHNGSGIEASAIASTRARQELLVGSRLVDRTDGAIDFILPVFREWYAARALIESTVSVEDLQSLSDRWLPVLSLILNSEPSDVQESLLMYLASSDPGLARLILADYEKSGNRYGHLIPAYETSQTAGNKLRNAMNHWKRGMSALYPKIGPVDSQGNVATIALELNK